MINGARVVNWHIDSEVIEEDDVAPAILKLF